MLTIQDLTFQRGTQIVLDQITLQINQPGLYGVVGPNGGGKSTLLKVICGLLEPSQGRIEMLGGLPKNTSPQLALVPQAAEFDRSFPINVRGLVQTALLGPKLFAKPDKAMKQGVEEAMSKAGVLELAERPLSALSGGELQRALVARALAVKPAFLLLDEPTASVDQAHGNRLFQLFCDLGKEIPVMVVSHDLANIAAHCERIFCVNRTLWEARKHATPAELAEQIFTQKIHCSKREELE